jgi:hypothetical protein
LGLAPEVQHVPTEQSAEVMHAPPMRAVPLHTPAAQLPDMQSPLLWHAPPLQAPPASTHRPAAQRSETQSVFA